MRVVIDTSVLVAAARSRQGASHELLSRLPDPRFQPVISGERNDGEFRRCHRRAS